MQTSDDHAVGAFLKFLEKDILEHPDRLQPLTQEYANELLASIEGIEVDMDAPLPDESELQIDRPNADRATQDSSEADRQGHKSHRQCRPADE
jgi:prlF antitoxin for toxin YhaV_toxin